MLKMEACPAHSSFLVSSFVPFRATDPDARFRNVCMCPATFVRFSGGSHTCVSPITVPFYQKFDVAVSVVSLALYAFDAPFFPDSLVVHSKHLFP